MPNEAVSDRTGMPWLSGAGGSSVARGLFNQRRQALGARIYSLKLVDTEDADIDAEQGLKGEAYGYARQFEALLNSHMLDEGTRTVRKADETVIEIVVTVREVLVYVFVPKKKKKGGGYEPYFWAGVKVDISGLDHRKLMALGEGWSEYTTGGSFTYHEWEVNQGAFYFDGPFYGTLMDSGDYSSVHYWGPDHYVVPSANIVVYEPGWDDPDSEAQVLEMSQLRLNAETLNLQWFNGSAFGVTYPTVIGDKYKLDSQILVVYRGLNDNAESSSVNITSLAQSLENPPYPDVLGISVCYAWTWAPAIPGDELLTDFVWNNGESFKQFVDRVGGIYGFDTIYKYSPTGGVDFVITIYEDIPSAFDNVSYTWQANAYDWPTACVAEFHTKHGLYTSTMPWDPNIGNDTSSITAFDDENLWNGYACLDPEDEKKIFPNRIPPYPQSYNGKLTDIRHTACTKPFIWDGIINTLNEDWNLPEFNYDWLMQGFDHWNFPVRFGTLAHDMRWQGGDGGSFTRTAHALDNGNYLLKTHRSSGDGIAAMNWTSFPYQEAQSLHVYEHQRKGTVLEGMYQIKVGIGAGMYPNSKFSNLYWTSSTAEAPAYLYEYLQNQSPEEIPCVLEIRLGKKPNQIVAKFSFIVDRIGISDGQNLSYAGWCNNKSGVLDPWTGYTSTTPQDHFLWQQFSMPTFSPGIGYQNVYGPCNPGPNWSPVAWFVDIANGTIAYDEYTPNEFFRPTPPNDMTAWANNEVINNTLPVLASPGAGIRSDPFGYAVLNGIEDGNWSGHT